MKFIYNDEQYSFQALRTVSAAVGGASDIGECLQTIYKITEGDDESWYSEWKALAEQCETRGDKFLAEGHKLSASGEYLRASNYFRTAEFFLHSNEIDPRMVLTWRKSRDMFQKSAELSSDIILPIRIPYEDTTLPGYLLKPDNSDSKRPLVIIQTGFDGTAEEVCYQQAFEAIRRGYYCLVFEGPGQGEMIREQHIPFRADWENVVSRVIDYALGLPGTDANKIILWGISFGGYLAPRAAAYDDRIFACIANGGVYDFHEVTLQGQVKDEELDDPVMIKEINDEVAEGIKHSPSLRWVINNGMFVFGVDTPAEWLKSTRPYHLKDCVQNIKCKMLIIDSEDDKDMPGQSIKLYDKLDCEKEYYKFTAAQGAEEHCQIGALKLSNEIIYNWIEKAVKD